MAIRATVLAPDEWYHCFTRGVDKRTIFLDESDYERYQMLLYASNNTESLHLSSLGSRQQGPVLIDVLNKPRGSQLVDIGAYCLMRNHPHLLLRERIPGGVSLFMQKVGTGYTMYFNKKNSRTGALFSSRFKARHVNTDQYLQRVVNYIHANPAELYESSWKEGIISDLMQLKKRLIGYQYSSLPDYEGVQRPHAAIINKSAILELVSSAPSFESLMDDAVTYYREIEHESSLRSGLGDG